MQGTCFHCRLATLGEKACPFDTDEIAKIEQLENLKRLGPYFFRLNVNLNVAGRIAQIDEMTFAHVAMRSDPPGHAQRLVFGKFLLHFADRSGGLEGRGAKWRNPFCAQGCEFLQTLRD